MTHLMTGRPLVLRSIYGVSRRAPEWVVTVRGQRMDEHRNGLSDVFTIVMDARIGRVTADCTGCDTVEDQP